MDGTAEIVSVALALVTLPSALVTTTVQSPASVLRALVKPRVLVVAPLNMLPLKYHWQVEIGTPYAMTESCTALPAATT